MNRIILTLLYLFLYIGLSSLRAEVLNADEIKEIEQRGLSTQTTPLEDQIWPIVTIKTRINVDPLSAVAIFAAYDYQKNYIPGLIKSDIHKVTSPTQVQVAYELKMPWPLSNGKYVNDHKLSSASQDHYKVEWISLTNNSAKSVRGHALFLPYPGQPQHTLFIYTNHVVPDSMFAGILRKIMVKDVEKSIRVIKSTTETLARQKSTVLLDYQSKIVRALNGQKAY